MRPAGLRLGRTAFDGPSAREGEARAVRVPHPGAPAPNPRGDAGRPVPTRAVVMYRSVRSGPPKAQAVGQRTGSSTTRSRLPSAAYRRIAPPSHSATQTPPSASTASPSGCPAAAASIAANGRLSWASWPSKSKTSMRPGRGVDVVHEPPVRAPADAVADGRRRRGPRSPCRPGRSGPACRRPAPRRSAWSRPTAPRRGRPPRHWRAVRPRGRAPASGTRRRDRTVRRRPAG